MRTIPELLDAVKARHAITSDYKLAMFLGLRENAVANYRHGRSLPNESAIERIAEALGEDPIPLLAQVQCQRAGHDETAARLWRQLAERLTGPTAAKIAVALAIVFAAQMLGGTDSLATIGLAAALDGFSTHRI